MTRGRSSAPAEEAPLVIAEKVKSALRLAAVNDAAASLGLKGGMALADAKAMYPVIAVADADPEADRRLLAAIADWCDRYTPLVGLDPPDGLILDVTGCAHLFGGEAALCRDIVRRLAAQGFRARVAVADTVGGVWAVARHAASSPSPRMRGEVQAGRRFSPSMVRGGPTLPVQDLQDSVVVVPSGVIRDALLALPLAALRIAPETVAGLAQVGLKRIADVIERPRAPLAARFGEDFVRRLDQAMGREDEPIAPRLPIPPYLAERRFADPIALANDVLGTIESLAHELSRLLERRGEGARRLQAALFRTDGKVHRIEVGTSAPLREGARIRGLFAERLTAIGDDCDPGFGFDVVRLCALATEQSDPLQTGLVASDHAAEFAHLVDRFGARFGLRRITRLVPQDTHIPEFAVAAMPAAEDRRRTPDDGYPSSVLRRLSSDQDSLAPVRPIRLFDRPERIEAFAEVPDGPPIRFRWRHVWHAVAQAEGPERIAMEWWRDDRGNALSRDYFRVESKEGLRVWLYREGCCTPEPKQSQWFLHGLFA